MSLKRKGLTREESNRILSLVKFLEEQPESLEFLQPVDWRGMGLTDYLDVVECPMDLSTVQKKVRNEEYSRFDEALDDLVLIWENCRLYNPPECPVVKQADIMERHMQRYCSQHGIPLDLPQKRSKQETYVSGVPYEEKLEFSAMLRELEPPHLAQIVALVYKDCPNAIKNVSESGLELKVDYLDKSTFSKCFSMAKNEEV